MPWRSEAGQYSGFLHAGLIGALIDTACGYAASTIVGHVLASHYSVNCLRPAVAELFIARAQLSKQGHYFGIDRLAMCLTFDAIYLLGNKSRAGFVVMMVGNLCWSAIGLWAGSYAMIIANLGFFAMNVRGCLKWALPVTQAVS